MHAYVLTSFCLTVFTLLIRTVVLMWREQIKPNEFFAFIWSAAFAIWGGILLWA